MLARRERVRPATSPASYTNLHDGDHVFDVRAVDASGNVDPTPGARRPDVIDTTAPRRYTSRRARGSGRRPRARRSGSLPEWVRGSTARSTAGRSDRAPRRRPSPASAPAGTAPGPRRRRGRQCRPIAREVDVDGGPEPAADGGRARASAGTPRAATIYFRSNEPGGTFQCSVDGRRFAGCTSRSTARTRAGDAHRPRAGARLRRQRRPHGGRAHLARRLAARRPRRRANGARRGGGPRRARTRCRRRAA